MESHKRKKYMSAAYRSSFARLVLNLYLYWEEIREGYELSEREKAVAEDFCRILEKFAGGHEDLEELDMLRNRIIGRVEVMTAFADCFQTYEYVLNRTERRFITAPASHYTPASLAERLVEHIGSMKHGAEQNAAVKRIVSQLPVRLTRQKFYGMILERLSVFVGSGQEEIENFLYLLETAAMVRQPEDLEQETKLYEVLTVLEDTDYRNLDSAGFLKCSEAMTRGVRMLEERLDKYILFEALVNDLYVLCLTRREALVDAMENQAFIHGANRLLTALKGHGDDLSEEELGRIPGQMEGIQESAAEWIHAGVEDDGDPVLGKLEKLLSGSSFMMLEKSEVSDKTADQAFVEKKAKEFCEKLDRMFANMPKAVARAVMANVLSQLPVVFQNSREIQEYIQTSLESCSDYAEREASMELLEQELMVDAVV